MDGNWHASPTSMYVDPFFFLLLLLGDDMELIMMTIKKLYHLRRIRLLAKIHFSLSNFVVVVL